MLLIICTLSSVCMHFNGYDITKISSYFEDNEYSKEKEEIIKKNKIKHK